jgi:hypothetical protein
MNLTEKTFFSWIIANLELIAGIFGVLIPSFLKWEGEFPNIDVLMANPFVKFIGILIVATILMVSIYVAIYTWVNFGETVSRRTLWRNSNVALFEMRLLYVLSRFIMSIIAVCAITFLCVLAVYGDFKFRY